MKFVADQNFPARVIRLLRQTGYDVLSIQESYASSPDPIVLSLSVASGRTLLTLDKDFGTLTFLNRLPAHCGVILFRLDQRQSDEMTEVIMRTISLNLVWVGYFTVADKHKMRRRVLPQNRA